MAPQTAEKFLELLSTDHHLRTHQQLAQARTIPAITRFAAGKGFIFTEADLKSVLAKLFTRQRQ
jgi:predicted ribosomally synthesized peptide with nif11-like leader